MRINATRIELTVLGVALVTLIALAVAPAWWGSAFGQENSTSTQPQNATNRTRTIGNGQQATIEGLVITRDAEGFTLRATDDGETVVVLTQKTEVKIVRKGLFRKDKVSGAGQIVPGVWLRVEGTGNAEGQLIARSIRFDEQDLGKRITSQAGSHQETAVVQLTNVP
jgi:hypothetical protein